MSSCAPSPGTTKQAPCPKSTSLLALGLAGIMVCFLRPNGVIAMVVLTPFLILFMKGAKARLAMGGTCAAVLLISWLWLVPIAGALGVQPSTTTRYLLLSFPIQQITNVVDHSALLLTERDMLAESQFGFIDDSGEDVIRHREPQLADVARWNLERMSNSQVLEAYVTLGLSHPKEYLEAFVDLTQAAWNPYAYACVYDTSVGIYRDRETTLFEAFCEDPATSEPVIPWLHDVILNISGMLTLQNVPLLSLLVAVPFYLWSFIITVARAIVTLDRRIVAPCVFLGVLALIAFCGPAVLMRYYLPLVFALPLMALCSITSKPQTKVA